MQLTYVLCLCVVLLNISYSFAVDEAPQGVTLSGINGIKIGPCPRMEGMEEFEPPKVGGVWYEQLKTYDDFEHHKRCTTAGAHASDEEKYQYKFSFMSSRTGEFTRLTFDVRPSQLDPTLSFANHEDGEIYPPDYSFRVMGANYDDWMTTYKCFVYNQGLFHREHAQVWSRNETLSKEHLETAKQSLKVQGIDVSQLVGLGFEECPPGYDEFVQDYGTGNE